MKRILSVLLLLVLALSLLVGCGNSRKYHQPDITLTLAGDYGDLIIREWVDGDTNGAEVYLKNGKGETLLGETSGTSDGSLPFSENNYTFEQTGKKIVLRWKNVDDWKSKTFMVP